MTFIMMTAKAICSIIVILFICYSTTFSNTTLNVPIGDYSYQIIDDISLESGLILPVYTKPVSVYEMLRMIHFLLDRDEVSKANKEILKKLERKFNTVQGRNNSTTEQSYRYKVDGNINLEGVYKSNILNPYIIRYEERKPFFNLNFGLNIGNNLGMYESILLKEEATVADTNHNNHFNISTTALDYDYRFTNKAYIKYATNIGNKSNPVHIGMELGRDNIHWGTGYRGVMSVSDNVPFYDMAKIYLIIGRLKWSAFFSYLPNYLTRAEEKDILKDYHLNYDRVKALYANRIELTFFSRLNIGLTETAIISGRHPSFGDMNPLILHHNLLNNYMNVMATGDFSLAIINGLRLYGEFEMDQWKLTPVESESDKPNTVGGILGIAINKNPFTLRTEYTDISKYMYNAGNPLAKYTYRQRFTPSEEGGPPRYRDYLIGHWLGPDIKDIYSELRYNHSYSKFSSFVSFEIRKHGGTDISTNFYDTKHLYYFVDVIPYLSSRKDIITLGTSYNPISNIFTNFNLQLSGEYAYLNVHIDNNDTGERFKSTGSEYRIRTIVRF